MLPCRIGSNMDPNFLRRQFFPWGVGVLGGVFFGDQATTSFGGITPGAELDKTMRWYNSAGDWNGTSGMYVHNPPFANLYNAWTTCNYATTAGPGSCNLNALIKDWFLGPGFPSAWSQSTATLEAVAASTCTNDAGMQVYLACDGGCDKNTQTGCCMLSKPFVATPGNAGACPQGYLRLEISSGVSDFIFENGYGYPTPTTKDSTLINFLQLVATKSDFSTSPSGIPTFVGVGLGSQTLCIINGSQFGMNVDIWANKTFTEDCPNGAPVLGGLRGCPQVLNSAGIVACTGTTCATPPNSKSCPATGCPLTPPPADLGAAWSLVPTVGVLGALLFV